MYLCALYPKPPICVALKSYLVYLKATFGMWRNSEHQIAGVKSHSRSMNLQFSVFAISRKSKDEVARVSRCVVMSSSLTLSSITAAPSK
jgi:hypothetical protein